MSPLLNCFYNSSSLFIPVYQANTVHTHIECKDRKALPFDKKPFSLKQDEVSQVGMVSVTSPRKRHKDAYLDLTGHQQSKETILNVYSMMYHQVLEFTYRRNGDLGSCITEKPSPAWMVTPKPCVTKCPCAALRHLRH